VTGATGQKGGSTARQLLNDGWHVRAVVRDPSRRGPAYGVYSVQPEAIELAGDELTLAKLVDGISGVTGLSPKALAPRLTSTPSANLGDVQMASFSGWTADIESLRKLHPPLMTFQTWLACEGNPKFAKLLKSTSTQ
jgi:NAD(P)-dependent dehydrogenase (short-subunit alcohol dehydrogenase family)